MAYRTYRRPSQPSSGAASQRGRATRQNLRAGGRRFGIFWLCAVVGVGMSIGGSIFVRTKWRKTAVIEPVPPVPVPDDKGEAAPGSEPVTVVPANPYAAIDNEAMAMKPLPGETPAAFGRRLGALGKDETEKARAVFRWIADNVAYDLDMMKAKNKVPFEDPVRVLSTRKTICTGYARIYDAIAKGAGLECEIISGWSPRAETKGPDHSWNAVKAGGKWQLVDVGWAAGAPVGNKWEKKFSEGWFFPEPRNFLASHFPTHPSWQLVEHPWSKARYDSMPQMWSGFFDFGLKLDSHLEKTIRPVSGQIRLHLDVPPDVFVSASLFRGDTRLELSPEISGKIPGTSRFEILFKLGQQRPDRMYVYATKDINGGGDSVLMYDIR